MVSATKQTWTRRDTRRANAGAKGKKARGKQGTPKFPIHQEKK